MAGPFKIHIHQVGKYNIYPAGGPVYQIYFLQAENCKNYSASGLVQVILNRRSCTRYTQQTVLYKIYSIGGLVQDILNRRSGTRYTQYGGLVLDILNRRFCTDIPNSQAGWNNKQGIQCRNSQDAECDLCYETCIEYKL